MFSRPLKLRLQRNTLDEEVDKRVAGRGREGRNTGLIGGFNECLLKGKCAYYGAYLMSESLQKFVSADICTFRLRLIQSVRTGKPHREDNVHCIDYLQLPLAYSQCENRPLLHQLIPKTPKTLETYTDQRV